MTPQNTSYDKEPHRKPDMTINAKEPYNAEPPVDLMRQHYVTPAEYFYVRNHAPVPNIDPYQYK